MPLPSSLTEPALAEWLHDDYEKSAHVVGWKTQDACRVPFSELPPANKAVMLLIARAVRELVSTKVREAVEYDRGQAFSYMKDPTVHFDSIDAIVSRVLGGA